ncbi:hypothetical protein [Alkaliphilus peptidifermentans]|uniref:PH domain-containing protein n=1 Tax=Alkaliphilus peptidifermentans DSM 18978 TaxID=1120976 RepID=A0A1G5JSD1_9FIRM|nr:hypothetical protein [Alkaliphilus peptidifermentans]SCY91313.1 hypothetical protein SAMN03080606_03025 [Alkaliphilus peptidifermentans DSM 18978]
MKNIKGFKDWYSLFKVVIIIVLIAVIFIGSRESKVSIYDNTIAIGGMYSIKIDKNDIIEISLREDIPRIHGKINGIGIFNLKKGHFRMDEIDKARLYLHASEGPYIYIVTGNDIIILNYKSKENTTSVYNDINKLMK